MGQPQKKEWETAGKSGKLPRVVGLGNGTALVKSSRQVDQERDTISRSGSPT